MLLTTGTFAILPNGEYSSHLTVSQPYCIRFHGIPEENVVKKLYLLYSMEQIPIHDNNLLCYNPIKYSLNLNFLCDVCGEKGGRRCRVVFR